MVLNSINYRLRKLLESRFAPDTVDVECGVCGSHTFLTHRPAVGPDFDPAELPPDIRRAMLQPTDGYCMCCGNYQRLTIMSDEQLARYLHLAGSKDSSVSEEAFHTYPVPEDFVADYDKRYFGKRIEVWGEYFKDRPLKGKKVLILRPFFGALAGFFLEQGAAQVDAMEISEVARRTTLDRFPEVRFLEGNIHGKFEGKWLQSGPYDVIVSNHVFQHIFDAKKDVRQLHAMLSPGGRAFFMHEIGRKPHNPFHINHFSETKFRHFLSDHFATVEKLPECDTVLPAFVTDHTDDGLSPDYVGIRRGD